MPGLAQAIACDPVALPPPPAHEQAHGWQGSPAAHAEQAQVQVPPPGGEMASLPGLAEQSHSASGHAPRSGQAIGLAQVHAGAPVARAWQNPPPLQSSPSGHRLVSAVQPQPALATQVVLSPIAEQGSIGTHAPAGQRALCGQAAPTSRHAQRPPGSAAHCSAEAFDAHGSVAR